VAPSVDTENSVHGVRKKTEAKKHFNASSAATTSLQITSQKACGKIKVQTSAPSAKDVVDLLAQTQSAPPVRTAEIQRVQSDGTAKSNSNL
jgi:hypothetical protein